MEGEDINDSNCINLQKISKIRDINKLISSEQPTTLKGLKIGIVKEFDIEELDPRNRIMQEDIMRVLSDRGA